MGWVLYKQNRPKEALDYILKAVASSDEQDATLYDHLGDIYAALKQTEKAREVAYHFVMAHEYEDGEHRREEKWTH